MVTALVARVLVGQVTDPEIPVLTIEDLGILRSIEVQDDRALVTITPTYLGCPALDAIKAEIVEVLAGSGFRRVEVRTVLAPAWTTDWISSEGRLKLAQFGIAPPGGPVVCPRCAGAKVVTVSEFGSTACKALMVCHSCGDPFDRFKEF